MESSRFPSSGRALVGLVYLGNDPNDLSLRQLLAYTVAPAETHPALHEIGHLVPEQRRGEGGVGGLIERSLKIDQ